MNLEKYKMIFQLTKIKRGKYLRILGKTFSKNNKNKGKIIYKNKKYPLNDLFLIDRISGKEIKFKMIIGKNDYNKNFIFENCDSLSEFSIDVVLPFQFNNLTNLVYVPLRCNNDLEIKSIENNDSCYSDKEDDNFYFFYSKDSESNISTIKTAEDNNKELIDTYYNLFYWNNKNNITNMSRMFYNCSSLKFLPEQFIDFNFEKINDISEMFYKCSKLKSLPDISDWCTKHVLDLRKIFSDCSSLSSLPDISKWNIDNVRDMKGIFYNCLSLSSLPDISKWNTKNVTDLSELF